MRKIMMLFTITVMSLLILPVYAQDGTQTYQDENIAFQYPEGWAVLPINMPELQLSGVAISDNPTELEAYASDPISNQPSANTSIVAIFTLEQFQAYSTIFSANFSTSEEAISVLSEFLGAFATGTGEFEVGEVTGYWLDITIPQTNLTARYIGIDNYVLQAIGTDGSFENSRMASDVVIQSLILGEVEGASSEVKLIDLSSLEAQCPEALFAEIEQTSMCGYSGDDLFAAVGQQSETPFVGTLSPMQGAYLISMAGNAPDASTGYNTSFYAGPASYEISFAPGAVWLVEQGGQITFAPDVMFPGDMLLPGDMLAPDEDWFPNYPMPPYEDTLFPGDMLFPGGLNMTGEHPFPGDMLLPTDYPRPPLEELSVSGEGDIVFTTLFIVCTDGRFSTYIPLVVGMKNMGEVETTVEYLSSIRPEQIRLYEVNATTREQTLLDINYGSDSLEFEVSQNTFIALYVFPKLDGADKAPSFMRYPPPQDLPE